jgi:hypothetical protein
LAALFIESRIKVHCLIDAKPMCLSRRSNSHDDVLQFVRSTSEAGFRRE